MDKILIAGFPYVRDRYFATFRDPSIRDEVVFLLPRRWTAKGGSVVFTPPRDERVTTARALFHHSHVPVIGGLLKGWMPTFPLVLWRMRHSVSLVYSCSEPTLLTTLYQAVWARVLGKRHICFTWENIPYTRKLSLVSRMVHEGILRLVLALSDGLICGNEAGLHLHRPYSNIPMEVIPMNGVDVAFFAPHATTRRMFRGQDISEKFVISFIGAIGKRKGLDVLVLAFARVVQSMPHAQLIIAGSGEYDAELTRRIEEAGISRSVVRHAWLDDMGVRDLLSVSDVFVYPSIEYGGWAEQFGYSMAEAMSMQVPVVSTRTGSIADVVRDQETGILIAPANVQELTQALERLARDPDFRTRLGIAGRRDVESRFSHQVIAQRFKNFFRRV